MAMERGRYFDNAATTPLDPRVFAAMRPYLEERFGNADSIHSPGREAREAVEIARERVAALFGADDPGQIVFTSGATEAANTVIAAHATGWMSPYEHAAVREPAKRKGYAVGGGEGLPCVMAVNNETGAILCPPAGALVDATQAVGKMPWRVGDAAFAINSAHKIEGPQGIGALYSRDGLFPAFLLGGSHEDGRRAGTLNVAAIVGFGEAARLAMEEGEADAELAARCRRALLEELDGAGAVNAEGVPHILSLGFDGVEAETLLIECDRAGMAISAGPACSARCPAPSHVLTAMGLSPERIRGTVRVSFGRFSDVEASRELGRLLRRTKEHILSSHKIATLSTRN